MCVWIILIECTSDFYRCTQYSFSWVDYITQWAAFYGLSNVLYMLWTNVVLLSVGSTAGKHDLIK